MRFEIGRAFDVATGQIRSGADHHYPGSSASAEARRRELCRDVRVDAT